MPTPDPEVSVNFTGPFNVHSDNVVLKGTVAPANAHVRINGQSVESATATGNCRWR